jgi:hypothetical protein
MPRRIEDIVPNDKRSVRNIPARRERMRESRPEPKHETRHHHETDGEAIHVKRVPIAPSKENEQEYEEEVHATKKRVHRKSRVGTFFTVIGIVAVLGIAAYITSSYFTRAVFTLTPRTVPVSVDGTYTATAGPNSQNGSLIYDIARVTGAASTSIAASDGQQVETKATGSIILYNSYSKTPWRLIAGTRLSGENGQIYRLTSSLSIPAYTTGSTGIVPGTIKTTVVADQAGAQYNLSKETSDTLSIVAYKGTTKYTTVYAKLTTDLTGGFLGNKKTVNSTLLNSTKLDLQSKITSYLMQEIKSAMPVGYILYDQALFPSFSEAEITDNGRGSALITVRGSVAGVLFKQTDLIQKLAGESTILSFGGHPFQIKDLDKLNMTVSNAKDFSPSKKNTLIIKLKGSVKLVGAIPVDELKQKFEGISLSETQTIIQSLSSIINLEKSSGQVVPPWSKIPTNPDKISIIVNE